MLGSQPKTDFFVTTNAAGHNIAENNSGDDSIETLEKKKMEKERNQLATCNKSRVSLLSFGPCQ